MRLYLVRHGIAEDAGPGVSDHERALTDAGIARLRLEALAFKRGGFKVDVLMTSPLRRSAQTAAILSEALGVEAQVEVRLSPGCRLPDLQEMLHAYDRSTHLMGVGHEPDLGEIVRSLTGAAVRMRKGTLADLRVSGPGSPLGVLVGLYDPEVLAALGGM